MGLFGIGEVLVNVEQAIKAEVFETKLRGLLPNREEWRTSAAPIARGSLLGFLIGVLPGGGAIISSFISYALEKKLSKHPERFGKGAIEGVAPLILVFVIIGAYSVNNSIFDVGTTIAFGVFGYLIRKFNFEPAPLVLAMILGPQLEASLRRSLIYSRGDLLVFFERPIAATLMALALLMLLSPGFRWLLSRKVWNVA